VVLAQDERLIDAAVLAVSRLGGDAPIVMRSEAEVLTAVVRNLTGLTHMILQDGNLSIDHSLVDALAEASPACTVSPVSREVALSEDGEFMLGLLCGTRVAPYDAKRASRNSRRMIDGLDGDGLLLRYQPIIDVRSGRLVMVEALARWRSEPVALSPVDFVPAMERMGLARLLAAAVTRIAARDMSRLPSRMPIAVSVNLPLKELEKRDVVAWLGRQLRRSGLPRHRLTVELTETTPVRDVTRLARSLRRLNAAGHGVLLDDLLLDDPRHRLLHLPFAGVKLDRAVVESLPRSARARHHVRGLARRGLTLTAEGVSEPALLRVLRNLGVTRAQGFWLGRPLPLAALPAWYDRWRASGRAGSLN